MNNYAHWAVIGSYVQSMEAAGVAPHYWMSNHVPGGHEYNTAISAYSYPDVADIFRLEFFVLK